MDIKIDRRGGPGGGSKNRVLGRTQLVHVYLTLQQNYLTQQQNWLTLQQNQIIIVHKTHISLHFTYLVRNFAHLVVALNVKKAEQIW